MKCFFSCCFQRKDRFSDEQDSFERRYWEQWEKEKHQMQRKFHARGWNINKKH